LEAISKAPGVIPVIVLNPTVSKAENMDLQYAENMDLQYNVSRFTEDRIEVITDPEVDAVYLLSITVPSRQ
jgi:hypothetical protein